jgi:protease-4
MKLSIIKALSISILLVTTGCSLPKVTLFSASDQPLEEYTLEGKGKEKILVMSIDGIISGRARRSLLGSKPSMIQEVAAYLRRAQSDENIKALLIKVNSPGGTVTASDILYHEIKTYKERSGAKIVVAMMNLATSGGYYISLPADVIMAHPTTVTGSVGVIYLRPNFTGLMEKVGVSVGVNTSGPNKDMGSPYRPASDEENALFQDLTDTMARRFTDLVTSHRKLNKDQLQQITTARVLLAEEAKVLGLVDSIGYLDDAVNKAREIAGMDKEARVVAYRRYEPQDDTIYNPAIQTTDDVFSALTPMISQLTAVAEAGFYYIWPVAIGQ